MHDNPVDVATKANTLFQAIMSAVSSYLKNVDSFIYNSYPDKLLVLIDYTIGSMKICLDRSVFDKRDVMVQHILRRCSGMKQFLLINQRSMAKFASMKEKARKSLHSRSSFAYENPYESKSPYGAVSKKPPRQAPRQAPRQMPAKSPYDPVKPRNLQSSQSMVSSRPKMPMSRAQCRVKSPKLKQSISNVSTAIQHIRENEENVVTVSEKPCEDLECGPAGENHKEQRIMEMLHSVAGEKIEGLLTSFLAKLNGELLLSSREVSKPVQPQHESSSPRVTSEVEKPQKVKVAESESYEKTQRVAKNVQYLYVKSTDEKPKEAVVQLRDEGSSGDGLKGGTKILAMKSKPPIPDKSGASRKAEEKRMNQLKQQAMKERMAYIEQMSENPLYGNEAYSQPWKVFGR